MTTKSYGATSLGKKTKRVSIGIDQSLTGFGLTILDVDDPTVFITYVFKSSYYGIERLVDIRKWLFDVFADIDKDKIIVNVAMEGTVLASSSALVLGELYSIVRLTLHDFFFKEGDEKCRYPLRVPPMTLKKYAAGKGNAKKQEMLLQMFKRWGIEFSDDNAADSYALARLAAGIVKGPIEKAIVEQMKDDKYRDHPRWGALPLSIRRGD